MARQVSRPMLGLYGVMIITCNEDQVSLRTNQLCKKKKKRRKNVSYSYVTERSMVVLPSWRGPIGWFIPSFRVLSISSRVAIPLKEISILMKQKSRNYLLQVHDRLIEAWDLSGWYEHQRRRLRTSLMKGIRRAFDTNPGTSFEVVTSRRMQISDKLVVLVRFRR